MHTSLLGKEKKGEFGMLISFEVLSPKSASPPTYVSKSSMMLIFRASKLQVLSLEQRGQRVAREWRSSSLVESSGFPGIYPSLEQIGPQGGGEGRFLNSMCFLLQ